MKRSALTAAFLAISLAGGAALPAAAVEVGACEAAAPGCDLCTPPEAADAALDRSAPVPLPDGALYVPTTFSSADGAYDVYVHFHGAPRVVVEAVEAAGINALVVVMNHGVRSTLYEEAYADEGAFDALLERVRRAARDAGLGSPHKRRVAIGSWSAGYGALSAILAHRRVSGDLDAVLVSDGIHTAFSDEVSRRPIASRLAPFVATAREAAGGGLLFAIAHSQVNPEDFASSTATADVLISAAGASRERLRDAAPVHLDVDAAGGYLAAAKAVTLRPSTDARVGNFHVRGYAGGSSEDHLAQFIQLGGTLLPELAERWR